MMLTILLSMLSLLNNAYTLQIIEQSLYFFLWAGHQTDQLYRGSTSID